MNCFAFTWCYFHNSVPKVINLSCGKSAGGSLYKLLLQGPGLGAELGLAPSQHSLLRPFNPRTKKSPSCCCENVLVNIPTKWRFILVIECFCVALRCLELSVRLPQHRMQTWSSLSSSHMWKSEISVLRKGIEKKCVSLPSCAAYTEGWVNKWTENALLQKQLSSSWLSGICFYSLSLCTVTLGSNQDYI